MLDQSFSSRNFRQIYDLENRRGKNVDRRFFPDLVIASAQISAASERIRTTRSANQGLTTGNLKALLAPLYADLDLKREERESLIDKTMDVVAKEASEQGFQLDLQERIGPKNITVYSLPDTAASFFVGKQLQRNIARLYGVKPGDRRQIVRQVKDLLSTTFDIYIVRTDVSSFYESIDQATLIKELDKDQLLSLASKSHIKCILMKYGALVGGSKGIPRGVGISAFLSELYMRSVDEKVRQIEGVTYYARYVDDIITIFSPTAMCDRSLYLKRVTDCLASRALALNLSKTKEGPSIASGSMNFEYLGYEFKLVGGNCELELSTSKAARYKRRIDLSFGCYERESRTDQKCAARRLVTRIKFLTGNTRLVNSKGLAFTGIYYNNSELTQLGRLSGLDAYLNYRIGLLFSAGLQNRLTEHRFKDGFIKRPFYRYSTTQMAAIVEAWKYEA